MRVRDALLYHLSRKGYKLSIAGKKVEIWAHVDDPDDTVPVPANPPVPQSVADELRKMADLESENSES